MDTGGVLWPLGREATDSTRFKSCIGKEDLGENNGPFSIQLDGKHDEEKNDRAGQDEREIMDKKSGISWWL